MGGFRDKDPQACEPDARVWHFDILLADGFVLTELAGIVDVLRITNRRLPRAPFSWTFRSAKGGVISSSSCASVDTETHVCRPEADFAFVLGNSDPDHPELSLGAALTRYLSRGTKVYLLAEAASRYIAENADRTGQHTTHWENSAFLRERLGIFEASHAFASDDGRVVTCAGMGSIVDVTLSLVGQLVSSSTQMSIANVMLHETIRDPGSIQPGTGMRQTVITDPDLNRCIRIMQANVEDPVPISDLRDKLDISARSLERKFRKNLGVTPNTYYRELRLNQANNLLLNTSLSIREIGLACGFANGFSGLYKSFFGISPAEVRKQRAGKAAERAGAPKTVTD